eukprot:scaffold77641_cov72-Phaeocystis_antarctica.AAC.2
MVTRRDRVDRIHDPRAAPPRAVPRTSRRSSRRLTRARVAPCRARRAEPDRTPPSARPSPVPGHGITHPLDPQPHAHGSSIARKPCRGSPVAHTEHTVRPTATHRPRTPCRPGASAIVRAVRARLSSVGGSVSVARRVEPPLPVVGLGVGRLLGQVLG